ncbi:ATP-binding protein [Cryptosporangium aurantiacum]|uniref:sensor histidine kinase n=1 Tax=Cryptosporangium aurantiacum TaxID=134849 RepID=UPI00093428DF|nr:ATP-binding protein [Cryptosporangium aurantiacum]
MPLDGIARAAARLLEARTGLVTLVDAETESFAGAFGAPAKLVSGGRAPLSYSVCKYVVSADHPVECGDMSADPALRHHPLFAEYGLRSFLGVPVRDSDDRTLGSVTVLDTVPRTWDGGHLATLLTVADLIGPVPTDERRTAVAAVAGLDTGTVLDGLLEAFVAVSGDGRIIGWNAAAEEVFGWSAAEIVGEPVDRLAICGPAIAAPFGEMFAGGPVQSRLLRCVHRDGRPLLLRCRTSMARGPAGAVICAFLTDETARTEAEADAARARLFSDTLLDSLHNGVIACDATGRIVLVNRAFRALHDLPPDWPSTDLHQATMELLPRLHHASGTPFRPVETPLRRALTGQSVHETDIRLAVPERPIRHLTVDARPLRAADGSELGAVATMLDVTATRRSTRISDCELRVARLLARAETLDDVAPDLVATVAGSLGWTHVGLWLVDTAADVLRPVAAWPNPLLADGRPLPAAVRPGVGSTGTVWVTGEPLWIPDLRRLSAEHAALLGKHPEYAAATDLRALLVIPIPGDGVPIGVLTCASDHPQHDDSLVEALLTGVAAQVGHFLVRRRERELADELHRTKQDYIALVGHELRTPVTSIATYSELLGMSAAGWPETDRHLLDVVVRNTARLRELIEELLDLSAVESGALSLTIEEVDLAGIVEAAADALERPASITLRVEAGTAFLVPGDAGRLRQVVDQVLSNAVKFSPDGGEVKICLRAEPDTAVLTVADHGLGIPDDERDRVFENFFRCEAAQTGGIPGAGLGLSIAKALITAHGGTVALSDGEGGTGTVVTVCLPRRVVGHLDDGHH